MWEEVASQTSTVQRYHRATPGAVPYYDVEFSDACVCGFGSFAFTEIYRAQRTPSKECSPLPGQDQVSDRAATISRLWGMGSL